MYFDDALNINGAGASILFITPTKDKLHCVLRIHFPASNNTVEYEACLHGLRIAIELSVKCLMVCVGFINLGSVGDQLPRQGSAQADSTQLKGWPR